MGVGEQHAGGRQSIDMRRLRLRMTAEAANPVIQVIHGDEQNVGACLSRLGEVGQGGNAKATQDVYRIANRCLNRHAVPHELDLGLGYSWGKLAARLIPSIPLPLELCLCPLELCRCRELDWGSQRRGPQLEPVGRQIRQAPGSGRIPPKNCAPGL